MKCFLGLPHFCELYKAVFIVIIFEKDTWLYDINGFQTTSYRIFIIFCGEFCTFILIQLEDDKETIDILHQKLEEKKTA